MGKRLDKILSCYQGKDVELIPILQETQLEFGYLPELEMKDIANFTKLAESKVYAVATFYEQFKFSPQGKNKIVVCRGTACHVRGAKQILETFEEALNLKEGETSENLEYTLGTAACIGCCALAPCVMINDNVEAKLTTKKVAKYLNKEATGDV